MRKALKLVVGIPAFNEQKTIKKVISQIPRRIKGIKKVEIIVVDDGSTDSTVKRAKKARVNKVISHSKNEGLGRTFSTLVDNALRMDADIIVTMDADAQFNAKDIPKLIKPIQKGKADVVTCTRFKRKNNTSGMPWIKRLGNRIFTGMVSRLSGQKFTDTQCGFRAYSREAALRANVQAKFTYTQEVLLNLVYNGFKIEEIDCEVKPEREGKSKVVSSWWNYGGRAMVILVRTIRDHHPLKFFGGMAFILAELGLLSIIFGIYRFLRLEADLLTFPTFFGIALLIIGGILIVLALLADLYDRQRRMLEELRYMLRKQELGRKRAK